MLQWNFAMIRKCREQALGEYSRPSRCALPLKSVYQNGRQKQYRCREFEDRGQYRPKWSRGVINCQMQTQFVSKANFYFSVSIKSENLKFDPKLHIYFEIFFRRNYLAKKLPNNFHWNFITLIILLMNSGCADRPLSIRRCSRPVLYHVIAM